MTRQDIEPESLRKRKWGQTRLNERRMPWLIRNSILIESDSTTLLLDSVKEGANLCLFLKNGLSVFTNRISGWHGNGIKMASANEGNTVKQFLMDLARNRLGEGMNSTIAG